MNNPDVSGILARYGLATAKSLGQNFLTDGSVLQRIAAAACPAEGVLEIGAGIGSLTGLLCQGAEQVVTVEIDQKLQPLLQEQVPHPNHTFIWSDILKCSLPQIGATHFNGKPYTVVGNLPYYITTDILMLLLQNVAHWSSAVLMVQREVAQRLLAQPGSKDYRAASVLVQSLCQGELLFEVPPHCFYPPPHVHSAVIRLVPQADRPDPKGYIAFVQAAFAARRKMLAASPAVQQVLKTDKAGITALLEQAGLPQTSRGEAFTAQEFCRLYKLAQNCKE
jgi:16S rRNA (adenine1518-N6/adenine1519-N6)-dimethyltransferase